MLILRIIKESFRMAKGQLWGNKLRSFLSLLGISIGIFCIIAVMSAVDSLQRSIVSGFNELGSNIIYIDKQPWTEDPGQNFWKYLKRPNPTLADYETIKAKSKLANNVAYCYFTGSGTIKFQNNSLDGAVVMGSTQEYMDIQKLNVTQGRFMTPAEFNSGANVIVIGDEVAKKIFNQIDPLGREIKMLGQQFTVIGVLESEGDDPFNFMNFDDVVWMSLKTAQRFFVVSDPYATNQGGQLLLAEAAENVSLEDLKDELTGILRGARRLKPTEDSNFALNEVSMIVDAIGGVFSVLNLAGFVIGFFALLVGIISVANIMFVSVKERTGMIGVKKALGAKRHFILSEFLVEAIFLCLVGGAFGLGLVFVVLKVISANIPFEMSMSVFNIFIGVGVSVLVGIIAGMLPALSASKLDPVVAMRH